MFQLLKVFKVLDYYMFWTIYKKTLLHSFRLKKKKFKFYLFIKIYQGNFYFLLIVYLKILFFNKGYFLNNNSAPNYYLKNITLLKLTEKINFSLISLFVNYLKMSGFFVYQY